MSVQVGHKLEHFVSVHNCMQSLRMLLPAKRFEIDGFPNTLQKKLALLEFTSEPPLPHRILHRETWGRVGSQFSQRDAFYYSKILYFYIG